MSQTLSEADAAPSLEVLRRQVQDLKAQLDEKNMKQELTALKKRVSEAWAAKAEAEVILTKQIERLSQEMVQVKKELRNERKKAALTERDVERLEKELTKCKSDDTRLWKSLYENEKQEKEDLQCKMLEMVEEKVKAAKNPYIELNRLFQLRIKEMEALFVTQECKAQQQDRTILSLQEQLKQVRNRMEMWADNLPEIK